MPTITTHRIVPPANRTPRKQGNTSQEVAFNTHLHQHDTSRAGHPKPPHAHKPSGK